MAVPYTVRFGHVTTPSPGQVVLFQATPGFIWVARDVVAWVPATAMTSFYLHLHTGLDFIPLAYFEATKATSYHLELRQVLRAGDELVAVTVGQSGFGAVVTGYQLTIP